MSTTPIPQVRDDDPEDVSWALSTAATQYARGDRVEALKWLRRAAEAASEAEKDSRALELAKAAAELTTPSMPPPSHAPPPVTPKASAVAAVPPPTPSKPPPLPPASKPPPSKVPPAPASSRPGPASSRPAPLSSRPAPQSSRPAPLSKPPARPSTPAPRPAAGTPAKRPSMRPPKPTLDIRPRAKTSDEKTDTNIITEVTKLDKQPPVAGSGAGAPMVQANEADAWPTESMRAEELDSLNGGEVYGQERTRIGSPAYKVPEPPPTQPPFRASQAVHVVIWRDADGKLRVAPRGTAVSAVKIEALLVAPSPEIDLLAWLTPS